VKKEIEYPVNGVLLKGYLVYPEGKKNLPGVLIVHEWWGHNAYARNRAEMLAQLGYAAFALDMYGDGKLATHPKQANEFMTQALNTQGAIQSRFSTALDILKNSPVTDDSKMAAMGYCFGGGVVLSMARSGVDLDGVISFHGSLQNLAPMAPNVKAQFLVLNGAADPFVKPEHKQAFKNSMDQAKLSYQFIEYPRRNACLYRS
jgi:dienelactone hydrolase